MTPFERLKTLIEYNLSDAVPEEAIDMDFYSDLKWCGCHTSGCRAGFGTQCPELQAEGYGLLVMSWGSELSINGQQCAYDSSNFLEFFGLTEEESGGFFDSDLEGTKAELQEAWDAYLLAHPGIQ